MSVKYASQLLSESVANALDQLREDGHPEFQGSEATSQFLRKIDAAFDLQDSKYFNHVKKLKTRLNPENFAMMESLSEYISKIKDPKGKALIETNKKTGFLGKQTFSWGNYGDLNWKPNAFLSKTTIKEDVYIILMFSLMNFLSN